MWEAFYSLLFASEAVGVICWPQGLRVFLAVKFQPKTHNQNCLFWGSSHSHSHLNRMMLLESSQFLFPPGSSRKASAPWLLWSPASFWEEDYHENVPWAKQARERPGPHPTCWSFPNGNQAKPYFTKAKAAKAGLLLSSCIRLCLLMQCTCRAATETVPGPLRAPNQAQDPRAPSAWAKMIHFPLTPPLPWSQNKAKQKTPCREGWMDWWFGLFCVFAFKWEGIIGGGGREKKQYRGGLVIFGAHLLEKWISLWLPEITSMFSRWYMLSVARSLDLIFLYNFHQCQQEQSIDKSHNWIPVFSSLRICWGLKIPRH